MAVFGIFGRPGGLAPQGAVTWPSGHCASTETRSQVPIKRERSFAPAFERESGEAGDEQKENTTPQALQREVSRRAYFARALLAMPITSKCAPPNKLPAPMKARAGSGPLK